MVPKVVNFSLLLFEKVMGMNNYGCDIYGWVGVSCDCSCFNEHKLTQLTLVP